MNKKINWPLLIISLIVFLFSSYVYFWINSEYNDKKKEEASLKKESKENDNQIINNDNLKSLQDYWDYVTNATSLQAYKDYLPSLHNEIKNLRDNLPKGATVTWLSLNISNLEWDLSFIYPEQIDVNSVIKIVKDFPLFDTVEFNSISEVPVKFENDNQKYFWYTTSLKISLSQTYLLNKYDEKKKWKSIINNASTDWVSNN